MKKIVIETHRAAGKLCGHVRLTPEAERMVRSLCVESGLSARCVVSQIILQGAELVEFRDE